MKKILSYKMSNQDDTQNNSKVIKRNNEDSVHSLHIGDQDNLVQGRKKTLEYNGTNGSNGHDSDEEKNGDEKHNYQEVDQFAKDLQNQYQVSDRGATDRNEVLETQNSKIY